VGGDRKENTVINERMCQHVAGRQRFYQKTKKRGTERGGGEKPR